MTSKQMGGQPASSYSYDGSNRLKTVAYSGGAITAPNVTLVYANDGNLTSVNHASGTTPVSRAFAYNANRNLQSDTLSVDGLTFTATYGYDSNDQLSTLTYPRTGTVINYAPNALGRPTLVNAVNGTVTTPISSSVAFYPSGQLQSFTRANGVAVSLGQTTRQMPSSVAMVKSATTLANQGYAYDGGGNLATQTDADAGYALTLGHDALDRINSIINSGAISYDGRGNLTAQNLPGVGSYTYSYDGSNRLTALTGAASRNFTYDGYANVTGNGLGTFTYDSASNLRQANVAAPAATFDYLYDGKNQRVRSVKNSGFPLYSFHALDGDLLLDYDSATGKMAEYIYLAGRQIARRDQSPATVTLTLASSITQVQPSQAFNLTATVGGGATGTVTFTEGAVTLGTVNISGGSATLPRPPGLTAGVHTITARYNGDATHAPGTTTLVIVVGIKRFDFDGDGKSDILWRNTNTGDTYFYLMNGIAIVSEGYGRNVPTNWVVGGFGDLDGDGKADILWRNTTTGDTYYYLMNGMTIVSEGYGRNVPVSWTVAAMGDLNGDGKADILWRDTTTGDTYYYLMNGMTIVSEGYGRNVPVTWAVAGMGDLDGDGKADILWRNATTGDTYYYLMNGMVIVSEGYGRNVPASWTVAGMGDLNGDGKADILWRNGTTGENYLYLMNGLTITGEGYLTTVSTDWAVAGIGDFDGDGKADIVWRNATTGEAYIYLMDGLIQKAGSGWVRIAPVEWQIVNGR